MGARNKTAKISDKKLKAPRKAKKMSVLGTVKTVPCPICDANVDEDAEKCPECGVVFFRNDE
jgi:hypothetical protein